MEEEVTLVRLMIGGKKLFVRTEWHGNSLTMEATDGAHVWVCDFSPEEAEEKAAGWEKSAPEFVAAARPYLTQQLKDKDYEFAPGPRDGQKKLSWQHMVGGVGVTVRWILHPAKKPGEVMLGILDMLADENEELKDTVERKTRALERASAEATKALDQSDRFQAEKNRIQDDLYKKFVTVLNAKKAKIRQLKEAVDSGGSGSRKLLALEDDAYHSPQEEEEEEEVEDSDEERRGSGSDQKNGGRGGGSDIGGISPRGSDAIDKGKEPMSPSRGGDKAGPSARRDKHGRVSFPHRSVDKPEEVDVKPDVRELARGSGVGLSGPSGSSVAGQGGGSDGGDVKPPAKEVASLLGGEGYTSAPRKRRR